MPRYRRQVVQDPRHAERRVSLHSDHAGKLQDHRFHDRRSCVRFNAADEMCCVHAAPPSSLIGSSRFLDRCWRTRLERSWRGCGDAVGSVCALCHTRGMTAVHSEVLSGDARAVLAQLQHEQVFSQLHLGGGTAAALIVGHRRVDVVELWSHGPWDWWCAGPSLARLGPARIDLAKEGVVDAEVEGVVLRLRDRHFPLSRALEPTTLGPCASAAVDALAEVLLAVREGAARVDFIDAFHLCRHGVTLAEGLAALGEGPHRSAIVVELARVGAIREQPMPDVLVATPWREIERFVVGQAHALGA